jgi:hypothetical protein
MQQPVTDGNAHIASNHTSPAMCFPFDGLPQCQIGFWQAAFFSECFDTFKVEIFANPRAKNKNWLLTLEQLLRLSVGVLIVGGGSYSILAHDTSKRVQCGSCLWHTPWKP